MDLKAQLRSYLFTTLIPLKPGMQPADDADLFAVGMDSLRIMQLLVWIEEKLGVRLPDHEVTPERIGSVSALAEWIAAHRRC